MNKVRHFFGMKPKLIIGKPELKPNNLKLHQQRMRNNQIKIFKRKLNENALLPEEHQQYNNAQRRNPAKTFNNEQTEKKRKLQLQSMLNHESRARAFELTRKYGQNSMTNG